MTSREMEILQQRLSQVEASFARLLHHLPGMAYRCTVKKDLAFSLVFASRGCEKLLGLSVEEIMNKPTNVVESLTFEEDLAGMRRSVHEATQAKGSYGMYYRIRLGTGEEKWIWDQGEGVFDEEGNCVFLEGIIMDVTSQKTKEQNLKRENRALGRDKPESDGFGRIVGKSSAMQRVYDLMRKAAKSDTSVILYGETGVGKDLAAQAIHELSGCKGRFIPVNCAAIPEHLLESEFFGHVKGAFSGAVTNRPGYLAAADKGTLFLDEIAELPLHLQVKLLRALESKTFTPVGSNEVRSSDFRLISATNRDLAAMVRQKNLRADFFYRIHVLTIIIPPLRERKADIPLLAHSYARYKGITQPLPDSLLARLETHPWAGNVRELHNALERYWTFGMQGFEDLAACPDIFSAGAQTVSPETLPAGRETRPRPAETGTSAFSSSLADSPPRQDSPAVATQSGDVAPAASSLGMARDELEQRRILAALDEQGWKKGKTAQTLGVTMRTLQRKLKKYGLSHRKNQGIH